jgi:hypothetical protein
MGREKKGEAYRETPVDVMEFSCLYGVSGTHNLFVISFSFTVTIPEVFLSLRNDINTSCLFEFGGTPLFLFFLFLNVAFLNGPIPSIPPEDIPVLSIGQSRRWCKHPS